MKDLFLKFNKDNKPIFPLKQLVWSIVLKTKMTDQEFKNNYQNSLKKNRFGDNITTTISNARATLNKDAISWLLFFNFVKYALNGTIIKIDIDIKIGDEIKTFSTSDTFEDEGQNKQEK